MHVLEFKRKQNCEIILQPCKSLYFLRGNFLFRQLQLACCGMTTVRKSGGHVATSRLPCRSVALQQPVVHSMASLYDYKIRESMNAFRFDAVTEDIFPGTLKICVFICSCWNAKMTKNSLCLYKCQKLNQMETKYNINENHKKSLFKASKKKKKVADMIRSAICLKITSMHEQVLTWNGFPYLVPAMSVIYNY